MSFGLIPLPGAKFGPCVMPCIHSDCASLRKTADEVCSGCGERIGYQKNFTLSEGGVVWHLRCYLSSVEQERR